MFYFTTEKEAKNFWVAAMLFTACLFTIGFGSTGWALYSAVISEYALFVKIVCVLLYAPAMIVFLSILGVVMREADYFMEIFMNMSYWPKNTEE